MANPYGFSLAETFGAAETIKGARTQNKRNELALQEEQRIIDERPAKEAAAAKREEIITGLRSKYAAGDQSAAQQLLSIDPEGGAKFIDAVSKMNEEQRKATQRNVDEIGKLSAYVLDGGTPEEQARRYNLMRNGLSAEAQKGLPAEYDPNFMSMSLIRAQSMDQILEAPEVVEFGGEQIMYDQGQEVGRADIPDKGPSTVVNLNEAGLTEEQKALAKGRVSRLENIQKQADQAFENIESLQQIRAIDLDTGFGTEARGQIAKVWDALGGDGEALTGIDPADVEKFNAVAMKQVLDVMATQKGPQTDQDAERIKKTATQLGNTREANNFIIDSGLAIANRKIEQAEFYDNYLEQNETLKGADSAWRDFKIRTPMVSDVVKDPNSGAPVFYYQFRDKMRTNGYQDQDIIEAWRRMNAGG